MASTFTYEVGADIEVDGKIEEGCTGGWFPAKVLEVLPKDMIKVQYIHVKNSDGTLEEQNVKKNYLRPKPPTQPYTDWSHLEVGMIVDHLVENLWWLAIVLWVKKDKKGTVKEVGCVYPRTAGEAPNVANEPRLLRPAIDWSTKACEWRPVFSAYKKPAFQEELDAQAKKRNLQPAEVKEDLAYIDKIVEVKRKIKASDAKEAKAAKAEAKVAEAATSEGGADKRGSAGRGAAKGGAAEKEKEVKEPKRTGRSSQAAADAAEPMRKSRRVDSGADGVHSGQPAGDAAEPKKAGKESSKAGKEAEEIAGRKIKQDPAEEANGSGPAAAPALAVAPADEEVEIPAGAAKLEVAAANGGGNAGLHWDPPEPSHRFHLRCDQPAYAIFHDARAYFIVMVLPAVEPKNCWTQVTESGLVEIAWSMWGPESHWAEMATLKLRHKSMLVNHIDDLLQPEETLDISAEGDAPPEERLNLFAHNTCIQLPVELHGAVHSTADQGAGRAPRASLRLGMYKIKIYKKPPGAKADAGAAGSQSDRVCQ